MNTDSQIQTTQLQDVDYDQMNGIRNTELSAAGKGYWYWKAYLNKDNDSKPALKDGRIAHLRLLEPELYDKQVVVSTLGSSRSKDAMKQRKEWEEQGLTIITESKQREIERWVNVAHEVNRRAHINIHEALTEQPYTWLSDDMHLCKAKADCMDQSNDRLVDYKFMKDWDGDTDQLVRRLKSYGYHKQMAYYLDGAIANDLLTANATALLVVIAKSATPNAVIVRVSDESLYQGRQMYRHQLWKLENYKSATKAPDFEIIEL